MGGEFVNSKRFALLSVVLVGSLWAVVESTAGVAMRGACTRFYTGSILTGTSMFFMAGGFMMTRKLWPVLLLPAIAGLGRVYAGLLLGQPIISGAVANPVFAFVVEAVVFCVLIYLVSEQHLKSRMGAGLVGITAAVLAANLFLPVKYVTGIPACVVPGSDFPLAIWGLPYAMVAAAISLPLGISAGAWARQKMESPALAGNPLLSRVTIVAAVLSLAVTTVVSVA